MAKNGQSFEEGTGIGRPPIGSNAPLLRAKVDPALKIAVVRSAAAEGITDAEFVRRVLEAHFARVARTERDFYEVVEKLQSDAAAHRQAVQLLVPMLELALKALLMRVPPAEAGSREERSRQAAEVHKLWLEQLVQRVAGGRTDELLALVGAETGVSAIPEQGRAMVDDEPDRGGARPA